MRICVISYSGTVGKTTIVAHLFYSRLKKALVFAIETVNETAASLGIPVIQISAEHYDAFYKQILTARDAIVDLGASNVEDFVAGLLRYEGSQIEFDYFVIPVLSGTKEQKECIAMVRLLNSMGIEADRIRIVFNRVRHEVAEEFQLLLNYVAKEGGCWVNQEAAIFENELYDMLMIRRISLGDILADTTNYRELARSFPANGDKKLLAHYTSMHLMQSLAKGVSKNLERVYDLLIPEEE